MDAVTGIITIGFIMILGFVGNYIFNRTQIPSIVWLLLFGLIIGMVFRVQDFSSLYPSLLDDISGLIGAIAIVIILFDGGINTDLHQLFKGAPRGLLLTVCSFCLSFIITLFIVVGLEVFGVIDLGGHSFVVGAILGGIVGGTSSPIVIPLAYRLRNLQDKTKMVSSIESILTDPICIVVVFAIIYMAFKIKELNLLLGIGNLVTTFSAGIVIGIALGFIWLFIMNKVRKEQFSYILTLAVVFLVYSCTVLLVGLDKGGEGAGAIACLAFGLVLGNGKKILKMVRYHGEGFEMDEETKQFHSLTSFVIRTFFFVYLGMIVSFQKIEFILIGIIILLALLIVRYLAVYIATYNGDFEKDDKQTMLVMMPRGLAAAILALKFGQTVFNPEKGGYALSHMTTFFQDTAFVVILGSAIITTIGISFICHFENKKNKQTECMDDVRNKIDIIDKQQNNNGE